MQNKRWKLIGLACLLMAGCMQIYTGCGVSDKNEDGLYIEETVSYEHEKYDMQFDEDEERENYLSDMADTESIEATGMGTVGTKTEYTDTGNIIAESIDAEVMDAERFKIPGEYDFTLCFGGDISLDEAAVTTAQLDASDSDITKCISPELITVMQNADLMCLNNEFTFSTNGAPMEGKMYTFRAHPDRVQILKEMGVDIVQLSNNHVYDYGKQALLDTFDTLEAAEINYFGAGRNLAEAMEPVYYTLDEKVIAFVGASRAEKNKMTPQATEEKPGILRCYDTELFLQAIKEAKKNADFVVAVVHWGTEYSYDLEDVQLTTGKEYLDAGADVIIGGHSHCLQGMEYYDGKPIVYSLGNYWFNDKTLDTMLVQLHFYGNDEEEHLELKMIPAIQTNATTNWVNEDEAQRIYDFMERISINVQINEEGIVTERATMQ